MKLDNRPKKLVVKGASPESTQAVRDWYEVRTVVWIRDIGACFDDCWRVQTTGQVESVETLDSGDILVSFRSRAAAEQVRDMVLKRVITMLTDVQSRTGLRERLAHRTGRSRASVVVLRPGGGYRHDAVCHSRPVVL